MPSGTPASGPSESPAAIHLSSCRAVASAPSASTASQALSAGSNSSIRPSRQRVTSSGESSRQRTRSDNSTTDRSQISAIARDPEEERIFGCPRHVHLSDQPQRTCRRLELALVCLSPLLAERGC